MKYANQLKRFFLGCIAAAFLSALFFPGLCQAKKMSPISGAFVLKGHTIPVGDTSKVILNIQTSQTFEKVDLKLKLSDGLRLVEGKKKFSIKKFKKGQSREFSFVIQVTEKGEQTLRAKAEVANMSPDKVVKKSFRLTINPDKKTKKKTKKKSGKGKSLQKK